MVDISNVLRNYLDIGYSAASSIGLCKYEVYFVRKLNGTKTEVQIFLLNSENPLVKQVSAQEIIASNNAYSDKDMVIGPLPKDYTVDAGSGGTVYDSLVNTVAGEQIFFRLVGDGNVDTIGSYYTTLHFSEDSALSFKVYIRKSGNRG